MNEKDNDLETIKPIGSSLRMQSNFEKPEFNIIAIDVYYLWCKSLVQIKKHLCHLSHKCLIFKSARRGSNSRPHD